MLPGKDEKNINGPSLVHVPAWIERPLGKYYLYFAHHGGKDIRLAYADILAGRGRSTSRARCGSARPPAAPATSPGTGSGLARSWPASRASASRN
jgi:hypothetical protein